MEMDRELQRVSARILALCWADPQFKERFRQDPAGIFREQGYTPPAGEALTPETEPVRTLLEEADRYMPPFVAAELNRLPEQTSGLGSAPAPSAGSYGERSYPVHAASPGHPGYTGYPGYAVFSGHPGYPDYPGYAVFSGYPGYWGDPIYAAYPTHPGYPVYAAYPGYPGHPVYAAYPGHPGHPVYAAYPGYPPQPVYPRYIDPQPDWRYPIYPQQRAFPQPYYAAQQITNERTGQVGQPLMCAHTMPPGMPAAAAASNMPHSPADVFIPPMCAAGPQFHPDRVHGESAVVPPMCANSIVPPMCAAASPLHPDHVHGESGVVPPMCANGIVPPMCAQPRLQTHNGEDEGNGIPPMCG